MKQLVLDQLQPGMVLAETVYSSDGRVLLTEGTALNPDLIGRLREKKIPRVNVNDENTVDVDPDNVLINRVYSEALRVLGHFLPVHVLGECPGETKKRYDTVVRILDSVVKDPLVADLYLDLRTTDDDTLQHSITVCVLSLIMGVVLQMNDQKLQRLGTGAIVHDIGKKAVPQKVLVKREDLTPKETNLFREHTRHGYHILRERGFDKAVCKVALYHHERWDGSGYMSGLKGEEIDLSSRIVAVADAYDDLTRGLTYKQKYLPHEALEFLYGTGNIYYDARVVKAFTGNICAYPLGSIVQLSTGETGVVVNVDKTMAPRPVVKIFYDSDNNRLQYPKQVDLSEEKTIFITKIL